MDAVSKKVQDEKETVADPSSETALLRRKCSILDMRSALGFVAMHLLALLAPFQFNWAAFWVAFVLYFLTGMLGITLTFHRNLAHKSFKLPKWLEYSFAYLGLHAIQGEPIEWVGLHRCHHQFVDTDRDPHSPLDGFWFSHMNWLFDSYTLTKRVSPRNIEDFEESDAKRHLFSHVFAGNMMYGRPSNVEELEKQAFYRFLRKTYILHPTILALLLYAVGGLPFVVWGMGVRIVWVWHITFFVNSASHVWGYRSWNTRDLSTNNWFVGYVTFGEGWHNNHHAFEYSARHGLQWWEFDLTWWVVFFLQALGLATNIKLPTELQKKKLALNHSKVN